MEILASHLTLRPLLPIRLPSSSMSLVSLVHGDTLSDKRRPTTSFNAAANGGPLSPGWNPHKTHPSSLGVPRLSLPPTSRSGACGPAPTVVRERTSPSLVPSARPSTPPGHLLALHPSPSQAPRRRCQFSGAQRVFEKLEKKCVGLVYCQRGVSALPATFSLHLPPSPTNA